MTRKMVSGGIALLLLAVTMIIGTPAPVQAEVNGGCETAASITAPTTVEVGQSFKVEFAVDDGCEETRNRVLVVLSMTGLVDDAPEAYVDNQYTEVLKGTLVALQDSTDATSAELAVVLYNNSDETPGTFCTEGYEYLTELDVSTVLSCLSSNKGLTLPRQNYRSLLSWADTQLTETGWDTTLILIDAGHSAPKPACPTTHRDFGRKHAFYMIGVSSLVDTECFLKLVSRSGFPPGDAPMYQQLDVRTRIPYYNIPEVLRQSGFIYNAHWRVTVPTEIDVVKHNFGFWNAELQRFEGWQAGISPFSGQHLELRIGEIGEFELFDHAQLDWESSKGIVGSEMLEPMLINVVVPTTPTATTKPTEPPTATTEPTAPPTATPEPSATATATYTIHLPFLQK